MVSQSKHTQQQKGIAIRSIFPIGMRSSSRNVPPHHRLYGTFLLVMLTIPGAMLIIAHTIIDNTAAPTIPGTIIAQLAESPIVDVSLAAGQPPLRKILNIVHSHSLAQLHEQHQQKLLIQENNKSVELPTGYDRTFSSAKRDGNILIIATVPTDARHVVALWTALECFTAGIERIIFSVPKGSNKIMEPFVKEANEKIKHLPNIQVHYFKNDRYDVGLWCDALTTEGYAEGVNGTESIIPYGNTILLNDSVFAIRHFNGILEELQDTDLRVVGLAYSRSRGYWLESILRGFSNKGIETFIRHSCKPADHPSFGPRLKNPIKKKRKIVQYHEIKLAYKYLASQRTGLFSADPMQNWWPTEMQNTSWVQNEKLWRTLKDRHRFPVAKVNQPYAVETLDSPLIQPCTSKLDLQFVNDLDYNSFQPGPALRFRLEDIDEEGTDDEFNND